MPRRRPRGPVHGQHSGASARIKPYATLLGGIAGAAAMSAFTAGARRAGSHLDFEALLATADGGHLTPLRWWTGLAVQLLNGGVLAHAYPAAFRHVGSQPGWYQGAALGLAHGALSVPLLTAARATHPAVPSAVEPPTRTLDLAVSIVAHVLYGAIVGAALARSARVAKGRANGC
jgi:hypothetical protein